MPAAEVAQRVSAAATERFGEDSVSVTSRALKVDNSFKAYGLDAAPAFD